ncbi:hypothetical protein PENPOL_c001G05181 [Penicillium polonicum]|uniref:Uncharacterized protein n=1 Tax=Penicillium polonicum TaxID=60169 RepID=A0A1V6P2R1_PENPO|nr:hypothetical protein PENPOL_c001G05181 [Penicillium polonicum]
MALPPSIYELGDEHPVIPALVGQRHTLFLTSGSTAVSSAAGGRLRPRMSRPLNLEIALALGSCAHRAVGQYTQDCRPFCRGWMLTLENP